MSRRDDDYVSIFDDDEELEDEDLDDLDDDLDELEDDDLLEEYGVPDVSDFEDDPYDMEDDEDNPDMMKDGFYFDDEFSDDNN